jgi:hypothetical protein
MKYDNLSKLLKTSSVSSALNGFDYTHVETEKDFSFKNSDQKFNIIKNQQGVFRTNCVDSLDRTNVVQSVFARQVLHKILYDLKIAESPTGEPFDAFNPVLESYFKNMWGETGDYMSKCYSGTGALKSDFTKTGKRTYKGAIRDGVNSSMRFYINNFRDGYNQDCHDYFLGNINPKKDVFKDHSTNLVKYVAPLTLIVAIILYQFALSLILPDEYENNNKKRLLKGLILCGIFYLSVRTIFGNTKKLLINKSTKEQ